MCVASSIRAMPENEIPPVIRGDIYLRVGFTFTSGFILPSIEPTSKADKDELMQKCNCVLSR